MIYTQGRLPANDFSSPVYLPTVLFCSSLSPPYSKSGHFTVGLSAPSSVLILLLHLLIVDSPSTTLFRCHNLAPEQAPDFNVHESIVDDCTYNSLLWALHSRSIAV